MKLLQASYSLLKETLGQWWDDNPSELGAALAYYAVFAFAPLAVLAVAVAGYVFGEQTAQGELYHQLRHVMGPAFAEALQQTLQYTNYHGGTTWATILSIVILVVAAMGLFGQLQQSLNMIWGVKPSEGRGWWRVIKDRLLSFVMVLIVALLLLVSLISDTVVQALSANADVIGFGPHATLLWRVISWGISFVLVTLVFALIYKILPDVEIAWREVWVGAGMTTVLFLVGNFLIGLYLTRSGTASAYGAAGSLVVILLWVYYSSQVLLFGAEFTQVYACRYGNPSVSENAEAASGLSARKGIARHQRSIQAGAQ